MKLPGDEEIDTFNKYVVCLAAGGLVMLRPPPAPMSDEDARLLAAYLVALSGGRGPFLRVLDAVEST